MDLFEDDAVDVSINDSATTDPTVPAVPASPSTLPTTNSSVDQSVM